MAKYVYKVALVFVLFNFCLIVVVANYRTGKLKHVKLQQNVLHDEYLSLENAYNEISKQPKGFPRMVDTGKTDTSSENYWGKYSRFYFSHGYQLNWHRNNCQVVIVIRNLSVFCNTSMKIRQESLISDSLVVYGQVIYNYSCKNLNKVDDYIFYQYQLPDIFGAYYYDISDPNRIYITAEGKELFWRKERICRVYFYDISNKNQVLIDSLDLRPSSVENSFDNE